MQELKGLDPMSMLQPNSNVENTIKLSWNEGDSFNCTPFIDYNQTTSNPPKKS